MANVPPPSLKQSSMRVLEPGSVGELLQLQMKFAPIPNASVEGSVENVPPMASQSACDCANGFGLVLDRHCCVVPSLNSISA